MNSLQIRDLSPLAYAITRIAAKVAGGSVFSPGVAIQPAVQDPPALGPRQMQYPVAVNLSRQPRRDYPGLTPFETLRFLAQAHPVAALCVRVRSEQIADLPLRVVARRKDEQAALNRDCDDYTAWLGTPDRETSLGAWLKMLVRDILELDAPTVYKRPTQAGGVYSLEVIDGSTIKPVIDLSGRTAGYQQVLYGMALSQYYERPAAVGEEVLIGEFTPGELWYQPYWPTTSSPYGRPPMEDMLRLANISIQQLNYDLSHFTDGNIPAALAVFDQAAGMNVDQVLAFEQDFNADLQANPARAGYMRFLPFPVRIERLKELTEGGRYESAREEFNVKMTCAFYGVTPSEIGFTADVNKATSEGQENVTYRRGMRPLTMWLKRALFDPTLSDMGRSDLEVTWEFGEVEDRLREAQIDQIYLGTGVVSPDEVRATAYPDLKGKAPGPPQQAPAIPGVPGQPADKLLKVADGPPDDAERRRAERGLTDLIEAYFAGQLRRLVRWLEDRAEQGAAALAGFWEGEIAPLIRALLPFYDRTLTQAVQGGGVVGGVDIAWDLVNQAVLDLARAEATKLAAELTETSQAQAARIIADWIETGGTLPDLTDRLKMLYPPNRAEMIGVTEVTRLYAQGNLAAWKAGGLVTGYTWETSEDERVCPVCGPRQGKRYDLEGGEMPPAHPRCRCWITPLVD